MRPIGGRNAHFPVVQSKRMTSHGAVCESSTTGASHGRAEAVGSTAYDWVLHRQRHEFVIWISFDDGPFCFFIIKDRL